MVILGTPEHYPNSVFVNDNILMFHEDYVIPLSKNIQIQWYDTVSESVNYDSCYVHHYTNGFNVMNKTVREKGKEKEKVVMEIRFDSNQSDVELETDGHGNSHWPCAFDYVIHLNPEQRSKFVQYEELFDVKGIKDREHLPQWIKNVFSDLEGIKVKTVGPQKRIQFEETSNGTTKSMTNEDFVCRFLGLDEDVLEKSGFHLSYAMGKEFVFSPNVLLQTLN